MAFFVSDPRLNSGTRAGTRLGLIAQLSHWLASPEFVTPPYPHQFPASPTPAIPPPPKCSGWFHPACMHSVVLKRLPLQGLFRRDYSL
jgi:hypothetical protein